MDLAQAGALCETRKIMVRSVAGEKYDTIIGFELGEKPAWREPGLDDEEAEPVYAGIDNGDLPF